MGFRTAGQAVVAVSCGVLVLVSHERLPHVHVEITQSIETQSLTLSQAMVSTVYVSMFLP